MHLWTNTSKLTQALMLASLLPIAGCAYGPVDESGRVLEMVVFEPDPDFATPVPIRLDLKNETLEYELERRRLYSMIKIWKHVFSTDDAIEEKLTLIDTRFYWQWRDRCCVARYEVVAIFQCNDELQLVKAVGRREATHRHDFVKKTSCNKPFARQLRKPPSISKPAEVRRRPRPRNRCLRPHSPGRWPGP